MKNPMRARRIVDLKTAEMSTGRTARARMDMLGSREEFCKTCPKPVWFTAFFDGTGNNFEKDGRGLVDESRVKYSNVAKLAWFSHVKNDVKPRTAFGYIEGVGTPCPKIGDSGAGLDGALGMAAARKGEARILWMLGQLKDYVNDHMPFVNQINLAVFGFSRGATQARAFTHMLTRELAVVKDDKLFWRQPNVDGKQAQIVIYFLGIFDTVSSTGFGGSRGENAAKVVLNRIPAVGPVAEGYLHHIDEGGHAEWAREISIPPYVERCVHYVAGHEVREKFPGDSIRRHNQMPSNSVELVYPGMHSDVGGGYGPAAPDYQEGRTNELARIPLCHMYLEAYQAGVPLDNPVEVKARAGTLFDISPELERVFNNYMKPAQGNIHGSLESNIVLHMNLYYEWRESRRRRIADGRLNISQPDPYMTITDKEWEEDVLKVAKSQTGFFKSWIGVQQSAMFKAYKYEQVGKMDEQERADFNLFFDRYVHDSIAGFKKQMSEASAALALTEMSRWSINRKYFMGKQGEKYLYWRYESDGTAIAEIRKDKSDDPATPVDPNLRRQHMEAREFERTRSR